MNTPTVSDADIAAAHPDLPGLGVLLDPDRAAALVGGGHRLDRLRIKPGASVTGILRPTTGAGAWWLVRALAPEPWATKRGKDLAAAERAGLPGREYAEHRLLVVPGAADRRLRGLAALRPDRGETDFVWRRQRLRGTVRTLSHNPARRWVGIADVDGERTVLRLHQGRVRQSLPWVDGRTWRPGDPLPGLVTGTGVPDVPAGSVPVDLPAALAAAVTGVGALHRPWRDRAAAVVAALGDRLARIDRRPAHGDLTPDQVVVGPGGASVLDWDRLGLWPVGWDCATWTVGLILAGWHRADGSVADGCAREVDPSVLAAAAVLRLPEPFRRRYAAWADHTEALLGCAERALGR